MEPSQYYLKMLNIMKILLLVHALTTCVLADGGAHHHAAAPTAGGGSGIEPGHNSHYAVYYHEDMAAPPEKVVAVAAPPPAAPIHAAPLLDPTSSYQSYYPVEEEHATKGGVNGKIFDVNTFLKISLLVVLAIVLAPYVLSWFGINLNLGRSLENIPYNDIVYYSELVYKAISTEY